MCVSDSKMGVENVETDKWERSKRKRRKKKKEELRVTCNVWLWIHRGLVKQPAKIFN